MNELFVKFYLTPFEIAIKTSQPWTIMSAYNKVNGTHCTENKLLQIQILIDEWKFEGLVMTDWHATIDRVEGLKNGSHLEMPTSYGVGTKKILGAIENHQLDESTLNKSVEKILELIAKSIPALQQDYHYDQESHHSLAKEVASQSIILLKNSENILPLKSSQKIAVIGEFAVRPRFQGEGSSYINSHKIDTVNDYLKQAGINFVYSQGYEASTHKTIDFKKLLEEAVEVAKTSEVVLLLIGLSDSYESEGFDRKSLSLPAEHNNLVEALVNVNSNVIVVLSGGSPVEIPWYDKVKGIVHSQLSGEAGAGAVVDIIFGKVNPSGKLTETYPLTNADTPCAENFPGNILAVEYRESVFVGYRYYDKVKKSVRFPFGFGLSYTKFEYLNLKLDKTQIKENESLNLTFDLKNTGLIAGAEIAQVYVSDVESTIFRPEKELKGFSKVFLQPNEVKTVSIKLDKRAFAFYNTKLHDWSIESGDFEILVGSSSIDIKLQAKVNITSALKSSDIPNYKNTAQIYYTGDPAKVSSSEFEVIFGKSIPPATLNTTGPFSLHDTFEICSKSKWGSQLVSIIHQMVIKIGDKVNPEILEAVLLQMPFRTFDFEKIQIVLKVINGEEPTNDFFEILKNPFALFSRLLSII